MKRLKKGSKQLSLVILMGGGTLIVLHCRTWAENNICHLDIRTDCKKHGYRKGTLHNARNLHKGRHKVVEQMTCQKRGPLFL